VSADQREVGAATERVLKQLTQARKRDGCDRRDVKLGHLVGHLLVFGRVSPDDLATGRLVVVTAPLDQCDLGDVEVRWSNQQHALGMCVSGWIGVRVTTDKKLVAPSVADMALVRKRLRELGWDWRFAPYEQRRWST
jgi:hypothetical protein